MPFLLSFISSGGLKWLSILLIITGLSVTLYTKHREIVDNEKQIALQQYNINQLQQNLKDKDIYLRQMEEISKHKSEIVAQLYIDKDKLEEQIRKIDNSINQHIGAGHDRQSSQILKDTIKMLGEMK